MTDRIRVGTMLIEDGTRTPKSIVTSERYSVGWSSIVKSTSAQLGKDLESAGWTFFYMAGEIRKSGFGFSDQSRADRAAAHVIDAVKRENCNCLEITQMRQRSFLGLRYTSLVAHARHIQKSRSFQDLSKPAINVPVSPGEGLYDLTPEVRVKTVVAGEAVQAWENEGGSRVESTRPT